MRLRPLVGLLAATLLVSGCGESPEPKPMPKPSDTAASSSSPSPPVMPAAAKEKSKRGAIAFTQGFFDALNYAGAMGDTQPLRRLYVDACTRCEAIADSIDKTYRDGGRITGGTWQARRFKFYGIENRVAFVDAFVDFGEQQWVKRRGAKPRHFDASRNNLKVFNLRWANEKWRVSALDPDR